MNMSVEKIDLKFVCTVDISPPNPTEFSAHVQGIDERLKGVAKKQEQIAIDLQSRNVTLKKIPTQYIQWQKELSELSSTIEKCRKEIEKKSEKLPFLNNQSCKECSERLSVLDQYSYRLNEQNIHLSLLSNSPEHQATLEMLKDITSKCEYTKSLSADHLDTLICQLHNLIERQTETLSNVNPSLCKSIREMHWETLNFLLYVTNCKFPGDTNTQKKIQSLLDTLNPPNKLLTQSQISSELNQTDQRYYTSFTSVKLDNNRYFKNGIYLSHVRYPKIAHIISPLENIARGLQKITKDLEIQIMDSWLGQETMVTPEYQTCLTLLKQDLFHQKEELYRIDFSDEVHSGLYYVASLSTWVDEIQQQIDFFKKIITDPWQNVGKLQQLFYSYLTNVEPTYFTTNQESENYLYRTIRLLQLVSRSTDTTPFFEKYKHRITTVITLNIARTAGTRFLLSEQEKALEQQIIDNEELGKVLSYIQHPLKSLIAKKIVKNLYFTDTHFDLLLEQLLAILETNKKYSVFFEDVITKDSSFSDTLVLYKTNTAFDKDKPAIVLISDISHLLQKITKQKQEGTTDLFFIYCQVLHKLVEAKRTIKSHERWNNCYNVIGTQVTEIAKTHDFSSFELDLNCSELPDNWIADETNNKELILKLLLQAIWDSDFYNQIYAMKELTKVLNTPQLLSMSQDIQHLLQILAFRIFNSNKIQEQLDKNDVLSSIENVYLPSFFAQHLGAPTTWQAIYDISTIECALYSFIHLRGIHDLLQSEPFKQNLKDFRDIDPLFGQWKQSTRLLQTVKNKAQSGSLKKDSDDALECQGYLETLEKICKEPELENNPMYKYIFSLLLADMTNLVVTV